MLFNLYFAFFGESDLFRCGLHCGIYMKCMRSYVVLYFPVFRDSWGALNHRAVHACPCSFVVAPVSTSLWFEGVSRYGNTHQITTSLAEF